ncbi:DUF2837 family protein [Sphingopyxis sp.]|uniref:DUF2837 family protein n=1 Tax=Sphingopyxis sp. TaxID=1908224 RepID=UPI001DC1317B|nr:DUF2837 family protein [Sphingopyxis sp.]MBW8295556.1 DUF2837 family protein [Sphingopyxis sp.]
MSDTASIHWLDGILLLTPLVQAIAFLIETSSWLVRAQSVSSNIGLYVGRSNIFLYSARMFTLIFTVCLAFAVESSYHTSTIILLISATLFMSALCHALMLFHKPRGFFMRVVSFTLLLPSNRNVGYTVRRTDMTTPLFVMTLATSVVFCISLTAPIIGAILLPEYRLSVSYIGQIINFFGTIIMLFYVDQRLFRAIDQGDIDQIIISYVAGRFFSFVLVGMIFFLIGCYL